MKRLITVALAVLVLSATSALAQQPQRGGGGRGLGMGPMMLLNQASVQKELKLSDDQIQKIHEAQGKQQGSLADLQGLDPEERRQKMQQMAREGERTASKILKRDQMKRLKEITLQQQGVRAFNDPDVAKALALADDEKEKIKAIGDEASQQVRDAFQGGGAGGDPQAMRKKFEEMRKASMDKVMNVLTAEQKTKWKELTGEPFKGEIQMGPPGGGRRRQQ